MRSLLFALLLLITVSGFAQDTWIKTYDPFSLENTVYERYASEDILPAHDGGFIASGTYEWDYEYGYTIQAFLIKIDADGNLIWAKLADDPSLPESNVSYCFMVTLDGGTVEFVKTEFTSEMYMTKRDTLGDVEWAQSIGNVHCNSIISLADGSFIADYAYSADDGFYLGLRKYNADCSIDWTNQYLLSGLSGHFNSVIQSNYPEPESGFYAIGQTSISQALLAKFNAQGDTLWTRIYDYPENSTYGQAVVELPDGDVVTACWSSSCDDHDPDLQRWSPDGDLLDELEIGLDNYGVISLILDPDGETIYAYGGGRSGVNISAVADFHSVDWSEVLSLRIAGGDRSFTRLPNGQFMIVGGWGVITFAKTNEVGVEVDEATAPSVGFAMLAYPNPFNPSTTLSYSLDTPGRIELAVYNLKGQKIRTLVNEMQTTGKHQVLWNGTDEHGAICGSGVYLSRLIIDGKGVATKKMMLVK
jgi:hypothetical protein